MEVMRGCYYLLFMRRNIKNSGSKEGCLDLEGHQIGDEGVEQICTLDTLTICWMNLSSNSISPVGIAALSSAKWDNIEYLWLSQNRFGNLGCKYISRVSLNLKLLNLNSNNIGSAGILHLSKGWWINLKKIWLWYNPMSFEGTKQLVRAQWSKLSELVQCELTFVDLLHLMLFPSKTIKILFSQNWTAFYEELKIISCIKEKIYN